MRNHCGWAERPNRVAAGPVGRRNCTDRPDSRGPEVVEDGDADDRRDDHQRLMEYYGKLDDH